MDSILDWIERFDEKLAQAPEVFRNIYGDSFWDIWGYGGLQGLLIGAIGWSIASWLERRHLKKLLLREVELSNVLLTTAKKAEDDKAQDAVLLTGSTVIAYDFFRTLFISIRRIIGGNIKPYERLVARGRRAALVRLKQEARIRGIEKVINVRFGASALTGKPVKGVEIIAYGTGLKPSAKPIRNS